MVCSWGCLLTERLPVLRKRWSRGPLVAALSTSMASRSRRTRARAGADGGWGCAVRKSGPRDASRHRLGGPGSGRRMHETLPGIKEPARDPARNAGGVTPTPNRVLAQDLDEPCAGKSGADLCGFYGVHTDKIIYRRIGGFRVVVMQNMPKRGRNAILKRFGGRLDRRSVAGLRSCTMRGP